MGNVKLYQVTKTPSLHLSFTVHYICTRISILNTDSYIRINLESFYFLFSKYEETFNLN